MALRSSSRDVVGLSGGAKLPIARADKRPPGKCLEDWKGPGFGEPQGKTSLKGRIAISSWQGDDTTDSRVISSLHRVGTFRPRKCGSLDSEGCSRPFLRSKPKRFS